MLVYVCICKHVLYMCESIVLHVCVNGCICGCVFYVIVCESVSVSVCALQYWGFFSPA